MNNGFEPQAVGKKCVREWFKNGLELASRRPLAFLLLVGLFTGLYYLPDTILGMEFYVIPLLLGLGCMIAESANRRVSALQLVRLKPMMVWLRLSLLGLAPWVPLWIYFGVASWLFEPADPPASLSSEGSVTFIAGSMMFFVMFICFITHGYFLWFMVPLVAVANMPLKIALLQASHALELNRFVLGLVALLGVSCLFGFFWPFLIFPWVAILTAAMYVSYLNVWFGGPGISQRASIPLQNCNPSTLSEHLSKAALRKGVVGK